MPTIVVGTEKSFSALRPVIFEKRVSADVVREATEAIREANPHLDLEKLEPGTVITVPESIPGVVLGPQPAVTVTTGSTDPVRAAVPSHGRRELDALADAAKTQDKAATVERRRLAKALDSPLLAAARKRDEELAADVEAAKNALAKEEAQAKERAAELKKAHAEWQSGLDALAELARQLPGVSLVESRGRSRPS